MKVPAAIPADRACLLGCAVMTGFGAATHIADIAWGETVMVIGAGAVGVRGIHRARRAPRPAPVALAPEGGAPSEKDDR